MARAAVRALAPFLALNVIENMQLLVSELVGNSVRHGELRPADSIELCLRASPETVMVEVADHGRGFGGRRPRIPGQNSARDSGWGLFLVDRIATRWGIVDGNDHRHGQAEDVRVWFELSPGVCESTAQRV